MTPPEFYPPTKAILESCPELFVKIEAHDASDPESSDLLWLEYTPSDPLSEGEVICISPLGDSWYVSRDSAFKYGGWTTDWDTTGTADDVFLACSDIQKKSETMTTQARKEMDELLDALETKNRRLTDDLEAMDLDSKSLWDEVNALKVANAELVEKRNELAESSAAVMKWLDVPTITANMDENRRVDVENLRSELDIYYHDQQNQGETMSKWKLVPVEPTPEMIEAALDNRASQPPETLPGSAMRQMFEAMVRAAPPSELIKEVEELIQFHDALVAGGKISTYGMVKRIDSLRTTLEEEEL